METKKDKPEALLTTWKQIASYLGVTVRTAQKWEQERGLPVHRAPGGRGRVYARTRELDSWRASSGAEAKRIFEKSAHWRAWILALAGLAVAAAVGGLVEPWSEGSVSGDPAGYRMEGDALIIHDADGRELWRKPARPSWREQDLRWGRRMAWVGDLCGDSRNEVLLVSGGEAPHSLSQLYCFDSSGEERWHFTAGREVRSRNEVFRGPYFVQVFAVERGPPCRIAVVGTHEVYSPTQVAILDCEGKLQAEYWHSGHFSAATFADLDQDGDPELYLGGTSDARRTATLVVLDPDRVAGASSEPAEYQLLGFGAGTESARIFFPRTCVSQAVGQPSRVWGFHVESRAFFVKTQEGADPEEAVLWELTSSLEVKSVAPTDEFLALHQRFWHAGRIDHPWTVEERESLRRIVSEELPDS